MLDLSLIYKNVTQSNCGIKVEKNYIMVNARYDKGKGVFNAQYLNFFISKVKSLLHYKPKGKKVFISFNFRMFGDDSVILYLELILKSLFDYGFEKIYLNFERLDKKGPTYTLYELSLFYKCMNKSGLINKSLYMSYFEKTIVDRKSDFANSIGIYDDEILRLTIKNEKYNEVISLVGGYVLEYLQNKKLFDEEYISSAVSVVMETMDNTLSHTDSDCVLAMKTCTLNTKFKDKIMLSIVVLNLDERLVYSKISDLILNDSLKYDAENVIKKAYKNHEKFFDSNYDFESFALVSAFQKGVTTRENAKHNSGRGLTRFLRSIMSKTEINSCYVFTGKKLLYFNDRYLIINDDGLIGFNDQHDYINYPPCDNNMLDLAYYNNGTLYNLMLIYDRGDLNE